MDTQRIIYLYQGIRDNIATADELYELSLLLHEPEAETTLKGHWAKTWDDISDDAANAVVIGRYEDIYNEIVAQPQHEVPVKRLFNVGWKKIISIAAAVASIAFGIWFYNTRHLEGSEATRDLLNYVNDITPGKNMATLSFNGRSMQLSEAKTGVKFDDDKLTYNDGSPLSPQRGMLPDGENNMVTATTPRGGTYEFVLQDGTRVWLNADSKLEFYPSYKNKTQRIVKLEGEGYFEVAKDKKHPFIVESAGQKVGVLGTHFNINAYKDNAEVKTTLLEGSIRVTPLRERATTKGLSSRANDGQGGESILKPNQQSTLANNTLTVAEADPNATAWVNGRFSFYKTPLPEVMKQLGRWYDVEVVYPGGIPDIQFTGGLTRNINASEVLLILKKTGVKFKIEGKKVIVSK